MSNGNSRKHSSEFKAKVALEAIKSDKTLSELASKHKLHTSVIQRWKKELLESASLVFETGAQKKHDNQAEIKELYGLIGKLTVERDFLVRASELL